jgi:hypothetical protein
MVTVRMELKGNETAVQATCETCWASGARAVVYLPPGRPFPDPMHCPVCGVERRLPKPPTSSSRS